MLSGLSALLVGAMVCLAWPNTPGPVPKTADELYQGMMEDALADAATQREVLEAKDPASWTAEDFEPYLRAATSAIGMAVSIYDLRHKALPASVDELREAKIIEDWPGNPFDGWQPPAWMADGALLPEVSPSNPFDGWQPMAWEEGSMNFKPGGLVFQVCPPEYYSGISNPRPRSFVLSTFGPTPDYVPLRKLPPLEWAVLPPGTATLSAHRAQTTAETLKKLAERK
jgi:hypothetical protein